MQFGSDWLTLYKAQDNRTLRHNKNGDSCFLDPFLLGEYLRIANASLVVTKFVRISCGISVKILCYLK